MRVRPILIAAFAFFALVPLAVGHGVARKHGFEKPYGELNLARKHELVHLLIRHDKWVVRTAKVHKWKVVKLHERNLTTLQRLNYSIHRKLASIRENSASRSSSSRQIASSSDSGSWVSKQIAAAEAIAQSASGDPWPNCPDPYDGSGASWQATVNCENGGSWYDSPGYYRCGLQFDPMWENKFGRLCP